VIDCDSIQDAATKNCCKQAGGIPLLVVDKCVADSPNPSGDCNIFINVMGDLVNSGQMNICCQAVNNSGTITGDITQSCDNIINTAPGSGTTGGTGGGTSIAALGTCTIKPLKPGDTVNGKVVGLGAGGSEVGWMILYSPPSSAMTGDSQVALVQTSGLQIRVEGETSIAGVGIDVKGPKTLSTRKVSAPASPPPFTVYNPKPTSMIGSFIQKFTVDVKVQDLAGHDVWKASCGNEPFLEAKGGSGRGCSIGSGGKHEARDVVVILSALCLPIALFGLLGRTRKANAPR